MKTYDVVVVGLGIMGSSAAASLAKRGLKVLGIDAEAPTNEMGSSHGPTRATRETYFESPNYVPLAQKSALLWRELEQETGASLLDIKGGLNFAPEGHPMLEGVSRAAKEHRLALEEFSRREFQNRYPGFVLPDGWKGLKEQGAGILFAPRCLDGFGDVARRFGADLRFGTRALGWREDRCGVIVDLDDGPVSAAKVVLTLGPWACAGLSDLGLPLSTRRIPVVYFNTKRPEDYVAQDFSVYFSAGPDGVYAGKPHFDDLGTMLVRHDAGDDCAPRDVNRVVTTSDIDTLTQFAGKHVPGINNGVRSARVCQYTMTPDSDFIIDHHAQSKHMIYATGFSGHGFKFAPVIGEVLADLATLGRTDYPVDFMSADRFLKP